MSGHEGHEPRQREVVSLGRRFWHWNPNVILLYELDRKLFQAKYGQIKKTETSGADTKVTLESNDGYRYVVTRHGKEDYSTNWYNWTKVTTVSY